MAINLQCGCGRVLRLKDHLAGKRVKCPECNLVLAVPDVEVVEDAVVDESAQEPEEALPARSENNRPEYAAPRSSASPPPVQPRKRRRTGRPRMGSDRGGGGG